MMIISCFTAQGKLMVYERLIIHSMIQSHTHTDRHTHAELDGDRHTKHRDKHILTVELSSGSFHWNHSFIEVNGEHHHLPVNG